MRRIQTEIEIEGSAERVWETLTDLSAFPRWNPFILTASGRLEEGEKLKLFIRPPRARGMTIKPRVVRVEPGQELRWRGHIWFRGLFDGQHSFVIEPLAEGRVRLVQSEKFTGILVPLILWMIGENTRRGFVQMNQALKARVEESTE